MVQQYPEYSHCFYPWMLFLWLTAVPCYIVLVLVWKIAGNIGRDNSFCKENAVMMKGIDVFYHSPDTMKIFIKLCPPASRQAIKVLSVSEAERSKQIFAYTQKIFPKKQK